MKFRPDDWRYELVDPLLIDLDVENARIRTSAFVSRDGKVISSQGRIVNNLIEFEDALGLAHKIANYGGLFPSDRIILTEIDGKMTVLEGNRRVCACQLLLRPSKFLPTDEMINQVPKISEEIRLNIEKIEACIVSSRQLGDPIVANLHAGSAKRPWLQVNQMRWAYNAVNRGESLNEIGASLGLEIAEVQPLIRGFRAVECARTGQISWSDAELSALFDDYKLDLDPYLRVVLSPTLKKFFGASLFKDDGTENFEGHLDFYKKVRVIALHGLVAQTIRQDIKLDKKTNIESYLRLAFPKIGSKTEQPDMFLDSENQHAVSEPPSVLQGEGIKNEAEEYSLNEAELEDDFPGNLKPDEFEENIREYLKTERFFEFAACPENTDQRIKLILREIRRISRQGGNKFNGIDQFPLSFSMLMRALLEWSLILHLRKIGAWEKLKSGGHDPRLSSLLNYCANPKNHIFEDDKIAARIAKSRDFCLDELNLIAHNDLGNIAKPNLQTIAGYIRPIINYLLKIGSLQTR